MLRPGHARKAGFRKASFIPVVFLLLVLLLAPVIILPVMVLAAGGTYPDQPFNGMQITYDISGATVTATEDGYLDYLVERMYYAKVRSLTGTLGAGTLSVSGTCSAGKGSRFDVTVWAGDKEQVQSLDMPDGGSKPFQVSVRIPAGATDGGFTIGVNWDSYYGSRRVTVNGSFTKGGGPSSGSSSGTSGDQTTPIVWGDLILKGLLALLFVFLAAIAFCCATIFAVGTIFEGALILRAVVWLATNPYTGPVIAFVFSALNRTVLIGVPLLMATYQSATIQAQKVLEFLQQSTPSPKSYSTSYGEPGSWHPAGGKLKY